MANPWGPADFLIPIVNADGSLYRFNDSGSLNAFWGPLVARFGLTPEGYVRGPRGGFIYTDNATGFLAESGFGDFAVNELGQYPLLNPIVGESVAAATARITPIVPTSSTTRPTSSTSWLLLAAAAAAAFWRR